MALNNCTITSASFTKTGGQAIGSDNATLIISPNSGYVVSASDFTNNTGSVTGISSITLADTSTPGAASNTVSVTVDLDNNYVMPSSDTTLTIDIDGSAALKTYTVSGNYDTITANTTVASETDVAFSATGNFEQQVTVFTKTFTASSGYYYAIAPHYKLDVTNPERYTITHSDTTDSENRILSRTYTVKYTFENEDDTTNNTIDFVARAVLKFTSTTEIHAYNINTSNIDFAGAERYMTIFGDEGAEFSLTVDNEDDTSIKSYTNQAIPESGSFTFEIDFPSVTDADQYDFVLTGDGVATNFGGSGEQPHTFSIPQLDDVDITIGLRHTDSNISITADKTKSVAPNATTSLTDAEADLSNDFTISTTHFDKLIIDDSTVTLTDFTNTAQGSNGGTQINVNSLSFTRVNDTSITAALDAEIEQSGNADVISLLALASYISGNMTPTNIALSSSSIAENNAVNAVIGALSTTDADTSDTHTYTLVSGTGSTDNASFNISGSNLRAGIQFDYETKSSYSVRIRTTDNDGAYFEKAFTISITNVNEAPTNITLSSTTINENNSINAVVGAFSTTDVDSGDTHTYTLVSGTGSTDNASFNISGSNLRAGVVFDYETKNSYSIRVRSTDASGLYFEKAFTITIGNLIETTNSYQVQKFDGNGATSTYYYLHTSQYCNSGSLALSSCDYSSLTNRFIKIKQTSCSGTEHIVKILSASETTANVYHADQKSYTSYSNANTDTNPLTCAAP